MPRLVAKPLAMMSLPDLYDVHFTQGRILKHAKTQQDRADAAEMVRRIEAEIRVRARGRPQ